MLASSGPTRPIWLSQKRCSRAEGVSVPTTAAPGCSASASRGTRWLLKEWRLSCSFRRRLSEIKDSCNGVDCMYADVRH